MKRVRPENAHAVEALERHAKRFRESGRTDADVDELVRAINADALPIADFVSALRRVRDADELKQLLDAMTGGVILPELSQLVVGFMGPTALISLTVVIIGLIHPRFPELDRVEIYRYMDPFWRMLFERDFQSPCDQTAIDALYSDVKMGDGPQDDAEAERFININFPKRVTRAYPCVTNYIQLWRRLESEGRQGDFPFYWKSAFLMSNWFYRLVLNTFSGRFPFESKYAANVAGGLPQIDRTRHHIERGDDLHHPYVEASKASLDLFDKRSAGLLENWAPTSWQAPIDGNGRDIAQIQVAGVETVDAAMGSGVKDKVVGILDSMQANAPLITHGRNHYSEMRHGQHIHRIHPLALSLGTSTTETTYQTQVVFSRKLPYVEEAWKTYGMSGHAGRSVESLTCVGYDSVGMRMTFTPIASSAMGMVKATSTTIDWPPPPTLHTSSRVRSNDIILKNVRFGYREIELLYYDTYAMVTNLGPAIAECQPMVVPTHERLPMNESYPVPPEFSRKMHVPPRGRIFLLYDRYASIGLRTHVSAPERLGEGDFIRRLQEKTFVMPPAPPSNDAGADVVESRHFALRAIDTVAWAHWRRYSAVLNDEDYKLSTVPDVLSYWTGLVNSLFTAYLDPDRRRQDLHLASFMLGNPMMTPLDIRAGEDEMLAAHVIRSAGQVLDRTSRAGKQVIYANESAPSV